jgi:nitrate reductase assembly molybdenum cofactor insertion protein NarJ
VARPSGGRDVIPDALPARTEALDALAALVAYPDERTPRAIASARAALPVAFPGAMGPFEAFGELVARTPLFELEELFTRTFDWSDKVGLELGWHLYGEQYDRGAFLVDMRGRLRAAGIEEGPDLPDHVGSCLRLLARMPEDEAAELTRSFLLPAVSKITAAFGVDESAYAHLIRAVEAVFAAIAGAVPAEGGR